MSTLIRDNMFDLIDSDSLDTAALAKELMLWMGTDELKKFVREYGYNELWQDVDAEQDES